MISLGIPVGVNPFKENPSTLPKGFLNAQKKPFHPLTFEEARGDRRKSGRDEPSHPNEIMRDPPWNRSPVHPDFLKIAPLLPRTSFKLCIIMQISFPHLKAILTLNPNGGPTLQGGLACTGAGIVKRNNLHSWCWPLSFWGSCHSRDDEQCRI